MYTVWGQQQHIPKIRQAVMPMVDQAAPCPLRRAATTIGNGSMYANMKDPSIPIVAVNKYRRPDIAASIDVSTSSCMSFDIDR